MLKESLRVRRADLIRSKLELQSALKQARQEYEQANYLYLEGFEKKIRWIDDAELIFQSKLQHARDHHHEVVNMMHDQFTRWLKMVEQANRKNYLHDLVEVLADAVRAHDIDEAEAQIGQTGEKHMVYNKIVERISRAK